MTVFNCFKLMLAASSFVVLLEPTSIMAQVEWPKEKTVTIVNGFPAGNTSDAAIRLIANRLQTKYGQAFVVENRTGAQGTIAQAYVAKAVPDGYTLLVTSPGPAANSKNIMKRLSYDPLKDFSFITLMYETPVVVVTSAKFEQNTLKGVISYAKKNPGKMTAANPGIGSYGNLAQLAFAEAAGIELNYVPYRGTPPILTDLISGNVDTAASLLGDYLAVIENKSAIPIAVSTSQRYPGLETVPTFVEEGVNFVASAWIGLQGPAGMNEGLVRRINADVADIIKNNTEMHRLLKLGAAQGVASTPEEFKNRVFAEELKWRGIIRKYGIAMQ